MVAAQINLPDLAGAVVGFSLTLFVLSYLIGDNPLYRLSVHLFIGASAGIAAVVAWHDIIKPGLITPILHGEAEPGRLALSAIPLVMSMLLMSKASSRLSRFGNPVLAFIVGVGAATAVGGAIIGSIIPQIRAAAGSFTAPEAVMPGSDPRIVFINGFVMVISTIAVLVYFQFKKVSTDPKNEAEVSWIGGLTWIGKFCLAVTLGIIFAGVCLAALAALVDRIEFMITIFKTLAHP